MRTLLFCFFVVLLSSCNFKEKEIKTIKSYPDLEGYFKSEAARLKKINLPITKTVMVNGQMEQKELKIANWEKEFESFIAADINKASWKGSFEIKKDNSLTTYQTFNDKIPVKKVEINYQGDKIKMVKIFINNTNSLYISSDSLIYYPDSLYQIKKMQKIKLMAVKNYSIQGKFN